MYRMWGPWSWHDRCFALTKTRRDLLKRKNNKNQEEVKAGTSRLHQEGIRKKLAVFNFVQREERKDDITHVKVNPAICSKATNVNSLYAKLKQNMQKGYTESNFTTSLKYR